MSCGDTTLVDGAGRPLKADWDKAGQGLLLCGIAVFFMLNTTGQLPWSFWIDAIPLWPLLIVSWGTRIAFERTRAPWLQLVGPAIILGGLGWVAFASRLDAPARAGDWKAEGPLPLPEGARRVGLDLRLLGSRIEVDAREIETGAIADARSIHGRADTRLEVTREDDRARLRLDQGTKGGVAVLRGKKQSWRLGVPNDKPLDLKLEGVMVRSRFELASSRFEGGSVRGVFLVTQLDLPPVQKRVKLAVNGVFQVVKLNVPKGTSVRVTGTGFPFNLLKRRTIGDPKQPGYEIEVDGIFSAVAVDVRASGQAPAPSEAPPAEATPAPAASPTPVSG